MITIHYRPLAFRRAYESVCLPVVPTIRFAEQLGRGYGKTAAGEAWAKEHGAATTPRPDPLGDAVAQWRPIEQRHAGRLRAPTTREIPIAVDATLPAIAAALERLRTELAAMGLAHQAARVRAIGLAVETVRTEIERGTVDALHRVITGES